VTDNGDGALTILGMGAGMSKYLGQDGFLFLDAGQFRFEVDHGGTPIDPSDDEEIEGTFRVVWDLTGRNNTEACDFCDDIHEFIGYQRRQAGWPAPRSTVDELGGMKEGSTPPAAEHCGRAGRIGVVPAALVESPRGRVHTRRPCLA
jgi:hypothetical protein